MVIKINRRNLLQAGAAFTAVQATKILVGHKAWAGFANAPAIRRNASTMGANDPILRGYRSAIQKMRALPNSNPCSWFYQAAIHGTTDPSNLPSWNTCHTDPTFFWAWHRMYLYWFERIVRKYSDMYDWAIPYWDWTNAAQRALPAPFRDTGSLLYESSRNASINSGSLLSTSLAASVSSALTIVDYFNSQSSINGPHGSVHVSVGGKMSSVDSAAQDPIFWLHHSQVDRIWNLWLAQGGGRSNPVGNQAWRNTTYTFFDECCQPVPMKGCDILRAALQLSYAYEEEPAQVNQYCPLVWRPELVPIEVFSQLLVGLELSGLKTSRVSLLNERSIPAIENFLRSSKRQLLLRIENIVAETQPGLSWEVHVGPKGFTPTTKSIVGILALFGGGLKSSSHFHPAEFVFPISQALRRSDLSTLEVLFRPVSGLESSPKSPQEALRQLSPVRIGSLSIIMDAAMPLPPAEEQQKLRREELSQ